jgi:radical SAM protein with 4Fe4S-binding SPASM domain
LTPKFNAKSWIAEAMNPESYFQSNHFVGLSAEDEAMLLFKSSVSNVNIEISSYCNRKCQYCPISKVDRFSANKVLPEPVFDKILSDLAKIDYDGEVSLNLYNEPTADRELLLARIAAIRKALPKTTIYFSSNGDYLDREYLAAMVAAGLSKLYVTLHAPKGEPYKDAYVIQRFTEFSARMGKLVKIDVFSPQQHLSGRVRLSGIEITVFSTNYDILGSDRAGSVKKLTAIAPARNAPCDRPFNDFTVSYDGTIFPCCQMFADDEQHKENYSIGNISAFASVFDAYASKSMAAWRTSLVTFGSKASPCNTCTEANVCGTRQERAERGRVEKKFLGSDSAPSTWREPLHGGGLRRFMQGLRGARN